MPFLDIIIKSIKNENLFRRNLGCVTTEKWLLITLLEEKNSFNLHFGFFKVYLITLSAKI